MKKSLLLTLLFLLFSCKKKDNIPIAFSSFYFMNQTVNTNHSIKFTDNDTVYFQTRFPESIGDYYTIMENEDKTILNEFLKDIDFSKYDSLYVNVKVESDDILWFAVKKKLKTDWVVIHKNKAPKEFNNFVIWIENFKKKQIFYPTKKVINIEGLESDDVEIY